MVCKPRVNKLEGVCVRHDEFGNLLLGQMYTISEDSIAQVNI